MHSDLLCGGYQDDSGDRLNSLPQQIIEVVTFWAERSPNRPALVESSGTWTYGELASAIAATKTWLVDSGVRPGDRVMLVCDNSRTSIAIFFAVSALQAWPVPVNARLSAGEIDRIREHSDPRLVLYSISGSPQSTNHAKRDGARTEEVFGVGQVGVGKRNENAEPEAVDPNPGERVTALIYTSGTTGAPKAVMLTHRNLLFVAAGASKIRSLTSDDRLYGVMPMSHAVGISVVLLGTLLSGATLYSVTRFDPVAALASLERDRLTVVLGAPAMFSMLLDYAKLKGITSLSFPALRIISSSSAPLQLALKLQIEKLFGLVLHNGYGVTECSPNIAQTRVESPRQDDSVGPIFPGVEAKLVDSEGNPARAGQIGELRMRGPNVMKGYYRAPEETASAIDQEGWFNTRDLARFEDDNLFIVGRTKELIVRFGLNVYPAEVEVVLNAHPAVVRSAVIGRSVDGSKGDEEIVAFVQALPGSSLSGAVLEEHVSRHLASYKRPSQIFFLPELPVTATGKVVKAELAKMIPAS